MFASGQLPEVLTELTTRSSERSYTKEIRERPKVKRNVPTKWLKVIEIKMNALEFPRKFWGTFE